MDNIVTHVTCISFPISVQQCMFELTAMTVDKMATTIYLLYCLCGIGTAQQIFMKHSNIRKSSASRVCNKVSKSSSQQQPPRANVFQLAKKSTNNKLSPTAASLHHRQPSISSFANLLPQIASKSSVSFSFKVNSIKKYLR